MKKIILSLILILLISQNCFADITTGLQLWYKFNDGSGSSATDSSGNSNTGTLINTPTWVAGKVGSNALSFNGSNQYVTSANNSGISNGTTAYSVGFWLYPTSSSNGVIVTTAIDSSPYDGVWVQWGGCAGGGAAKTICFGTSSTSTGVNNYVYYNSALTLNTWTHVVVTYDGTCGNAHQLIYINGSSVSTTSVANAGCGTQTNRTWYVAATHTPDSYVAATIDEVRIYNRALSAADALELYQYPPAIPLILNALMNKIELNKAMLQHT